MNQVAKLPSYAAPTTCDFGGDGLKLKLEWLIQSDLGLIDWFQLSGMR